MQFALTQSPPAAQVWPLSFLQAPAPSQEFVPEQVPSSVPNATFEQVPSLPVTLHDRQAVVHEPLQQYPSTQFPPRQSPLTEQVCPFVFLQPPLPSQRLPPVQAGVPLLSAWLAGVFTHFPRLLITLQDLHWPPHAFSQQ